MTYKPKHKGWSLKLTVSERGLVLFTERKDAATARYVLAIMEDHTTTSSYHTYPFLFVPVGIALLTPKKPSLYSFMCTLIIVCILKSSDFVVKYSRSGNC